MARSFIPASIKHLQNPLHFTTPHVEVEGFVGAHTLEPDGDWHLRLVEVDLGSEVRNMAQEEFVVCECIPEHLVDAPPLHALVRVQGIARWDLEHGWREVHPVLSVEVLS